MFVIPSMELASDTSRAYAAAVAETLRDWEVAGFCRAQIVAPTSAHQGAGLMAIEEILRNVHGPVQVAGPFQSTDEIEAVASAGAAFIVIGGRALDEFDWLSTVAGRFPHQLILQTPARERRLRSRGAMRTLPHDLRDITAEIAQMPLAGLMVDFPAEAAIDHPELALLEDITEEVSFSVIASGGAPSLTTLRDLEFRGVAGTVIAAAHLSAAFDEQVLARSFSD